MSKITTGSSPPDPQTPPKAKGTFGVRGGDLPMGKTDWDRLKAMTEEDINAAALSDPDCPPLTGEQLSRFKRVNAIRDIRGRLGMTQAAFSAAFRLPLSTVRDWEQGRTTPDAPARTLLTAIARDPETMRRLVGGEVA